MEDVNKVDINRQNSGKRMRRRKRMMSVYVISVVLLVISVGVTMCFTFLFNVDKIIVSGESETYSYMQIVESSGVRAGDNLFRMNTDKAEKQILDDLLYVETANVERDFPSTIKITVTRCIPAYNIQYDNGVLLVSRQGKILSNNDFYTDIDNLPIIYGFEPAEMEEGKALKSVNSNKFDAFLQIISRFDRDDNKQIESIDITNEYDIIVNYRNGLVFSMGNWSDVEYKLDLAQNVMRDENVIGKKGYLTMIGSNQCSFRGNGETETNTTVTTTGSTTTTTETVTTAVDYDYNDYGYDYNDYGYDYNDNGYDYNDYGYDYNDYGYNDDTQW
ncbi:MAG: FtsQ-type POTRA domain-containing protein [Ruminococcus sp.]|nr:FtsQ-type POTRA domain-containing protein [Ruminococcus sp.]